MIPTDSTMLTKSLAMQTILTTSWITISTAQSNTVVITSLTVHFFFLSINPFLRFLLIYTTVKNPSIHAAIICNANKTIVRTDALVFLFTAWLIPVKKPEDGRCNSEITTHAPGTVLPIFFSETVFAPASYASGVPDAYAAGARNAIIVSAARKHWRVLYLIRLSIGS